MIQSKLVSYTAPCSSAIPGSSSSSSVLDEHEHALASPPVSKEAKLFDFINPRLRGNNTTTDKLSHADVRQQYAAFIAVADEEMMGVVYTFSTKGGFMP